MLKNDKAKAIRFSTLNALCKELDCQPGDLLKYHPEDSELIEMGVDPGVENGDLMLPRAVGCPECNGRGYSGRVALFEVLVMNDPLRDMAYREIPTTEIRKTARKKGPA